MRVSFTRQPDLVLQFLRFGRVLATEQDASGKVALHPAVLRIAPVAYLGSRERDYLPEFDIVYDLGPVVDLAGEDIALAGDLVDPELFGLGVVDYRDLDCKIAGAGHLAIECVQEGCQGLLSPGEGRLHLRIAGGDIEGGVALCFLQQGLGLRWRKAQQT
jgi:hypothetical protein